MKPLCAVSPSDTAQVFKALRVALGGGDALCVTDGTPPVPEVPDECALVVLTSGSTSSPKRVALSTGALVTSARATEDAIGSGRWVLALPLTYIAGIMVLVRSVVAGTEPVEYDLERFDAVEFSRFVATLPEADWYTALVPTQLDRLVDLAERDPGARDALGRFRRILVGGQAIPPGLVDRARMLGIAVSTTYGSAETAGGVVYDGEPIGDTAIRIGDDERVIIATSSLASGYLGDDGPNAFAIENGVRWWHTSDRGEMVDGRLRILGRLDDVIVSGGVKVALGDIDRVLRDAGVEAVAGWFPDLEWGQVPGVVTTSDVDLDTMRTIVEAVLGKAARPYRIVRVDDIPKLGSGKVDRVRVVELVTGAAT